MPQSAKKYRAIMANEASERLLKQKGELAERWQDVEALFRDHVENTGEPGLVEPFLEEISKEREEKGSDYVAVIQGLDESWSAKGTAWLQGIVDRISLAVMERMPSFLNE